MTRKEIFQKVKDNSEIINDHLWYVDPDDIIEAIENTEMLTAKNSIVETTKYFDKQVQLFGNKLPFVFINANETTQDERDLMVYRQAIMDVQRVITRMYKPGRIEEYERKEKRIDEQNGKNIEKAKAYRMLKGLLKIADIAREPATLSEIKGLIINMEAWAEAFGINMDRLLEEHNREVNKMKDL